jgi:hypothetical protein
MEDVLTHGSKWPLVEISEEERVNNLNNALTFGYHKGTLAKPELLLNLSAKTSNMAAESLSLLTA